MGFLILRLVGIKIISFTFAIALAVSMFFAYMLGSLETTCIISLVSTGIACVVTGVMAHIKSKKVMDLSPQVISRMLKLLDEIDDPADEDAGQ